MALFRQITVIAPGLLGGSLAMACRQRNLAHSVVGVARRQATLDEGLRRGAFDRATLDVQDGIEAADIVVLGAPVRASIGLLEKIAPYIPPDCAVTDLGSTKAEIMAAAQKLIGPGRFVGGHPMAGSHESGIAAADPALFEGARYLLTQDGQTDGRLLQRLEALAAGVGASPLWLDAADHDHLVARISHLPHVAACALVECAEQYEVSGIHACSLASTGFRDTTRIAAGNSPMWTDICLTNRDGLLEGMDAYLLSLSRLRSIIADGKGEELSRWFESVAEVRRTLEE